MNYAIILTNSNSMYYILGKRVIDYIIDEIKKTKIDEILCFNNKDFVNKNSINNLCQDGFSIILNGDSPLIDMALINELINNHLSNNNDLSIGIGNELDENIYCIKTKLLKNLGDLSNYEVLFCDKKNGKYNFKNKLARCKSALKLASLEECVRLEIINKHLKNGVIIEGINNVYISKDSIIENNVVIRNSSILGNSIIYSGSNIINSEINNSIIYNNSMIDYSVINDSIIGDNCNIGPFSNIRNNSIITRNNRIGNFVEVKNSKIGENSKLSHLAYMGDTNCGNNVNFGCGSITVNYDGKAKHKTYIGNNAFIGCNSNLIAPIEIKDNSFIAAGSTIVNNLDDGDFAIARSVQITKKGYASKYE